MSWGGRQYVAIAGTWAQDDPRRPMDPWRDWWHPRSHWAADLAAMGWRPLRPDPYRWSTDLDGTWLDRILRRRRWADWIAAAYALCYYCGHEAERVADREGPVLIAHSHGGQVALLAWMLGLRPRGLITVATPVRSDVLEALGPSRPIRWVHCHGDGSDRWQWLGEIGDGVVGIVRRMPPPARNLPAARGLGHSGLLTSLQGLRRWPMILRTLESIEADEPPSG